jgi:hypothetical protein
MKTLFDSGFSEPFVYFLIGVLLVLLIIQILFLVKVRKSLTQIRQFLRMINTIFRDMTHIQSLTVSTARSNQESLKNLRKPRIKSNRKNTCQICKHRLAFVKMGSKSFSFQYQCDLSKEEISLEHVCSHFEMDVESKSSEPS